MSIDYDAQVEMRYHPENFATTVENEDLDCFNCGHGSDRHNNGVSCDMCWCKELE